MDKKDKKSKKQEKIRKEIKENYKIGIDYYKEVTQHEH